MATRGSTTRLISLILLAIGSALLVIATALPFWPADKIAKQIPLDLAYTLNTTATDAVVLKQNSLTEEGPLAVEDKKVKVARQTFVTVEDPADSDKATLQAGTTYRRTDRFGDLGMLDFRPDLGHTKGFIDNPILDRVVVDRHTGEPVDLESGSVDVGEIPPGTPAVHDGLTYHFPYDTQQQDYPFFDVTLRKATPISFVAEEEINSTPVYHFSQKIEDTNLYQAIKGVPGAAYRFALPADKLGGEGKDIVPADRWYANERDVWVEPRTGTIVAISEKPNNSLRVANDPTKTITTFSGSFTTDEDNVTSLIELAKSQIDKVSLYSRVLPLGIGIAGLVALIVGAVLLFRQREDEDTGGHVMPTKLSRFNPFAKR